MTNRRCKMCLRSLPAEKFPYRKVRCEDCVSVLASQRSAESEILSSLPPEGSKTCFRCEKTKPESEFYSTPNGRLQASCKKCHSDRRKAERRLKAARLLNGEETERDLRDRRKASEHQLKRSYSLTLEEYEARFAEQKGLCLICGNPETMIRHGKLVRLAVDHCHRTGVVRGLLCSNCNRALGLLGDDPALARSAAAYLERCRQVT
jgi:hypothetical protein